jgi:hypothetical protein
MSAQDVILALGENHPGAIVVVGKWIMSNPLGLMEVLLLDTKHLYGERIWELYCLCDEDLERFKYHVDVELPDQETGKISATGPYAPRYDDKKALEDFWEKRSFGKPGSFWALEHPPSERAYKYPIR